jgi:hypothetical protein
MSITKIYCFGDGFAAGHIWSEWPDIIKAIYPNIQVENFGKIGAGNEFIFSSIIHAHSQDPDAYFLIQWADNRRFDKLLEDESWNNIIDNDPIYFFNKVKLNDQNWWLSSASQNYEIQKYHNFYVQKEQSANRLYNYQYIVSALLKNQAIFFSSYPAKIFHINEKLKIDIDMESFSISNNIKHLRLNEIQPAPPIHYAYVEKFILPLLPFDYCKKTSKNLEKKINNFVWTPYHPDRNFLWEQLLKAC